MTAAAPWPAPAKLNLFLHVTGRRADGYHELQTLFQFLDVADELTFAVNTSGHIARTRAHPHIPENKDLCIRAARLLQTAAGVTQGVEIDLKKRIPVGGGLGGGSSDAATTLLALNELWGIRWPHARLGSLALQLGADVPVFIFGHAAWAEGVGERLTAVAPASVCYVVMAPPVAVSTAAVFADPELTRASAAITIRDFHAGRTRNDLEAVVRKRYPEVDKVLNGLSQFGPARMTGSGACVFLPVADTSAGRAILTEVSSRLGPSYTGFVAQGVNVHPVHTRLGCAPGG